MKTLDEQLQDLKLYLNKLKRIVTNESSFSLGNKRIISKARVDDIVCCVQANYPDDYTEYVKRNGIKSLQSHLCYQQLLAVVTKKFILSPNHYLIDFARFMSLLNMLVQTMEKEKVRVVNDNSFKL